MKRLINLLIAILLMFSIALSAQQKEKILPDKSDELYLSNSQKEVIRAIFSKFNPEKLTVEDAIEIHELLKEKGLRGSPAVDEIITEVGFDSEKIRNLAPPPGENPNETRQVKENKLVSRFLQPNKSGFKIISSGVDEEGTLSSRHTGDGMGLSMPLQWTNVPAGTKGFALNVWHLPNNSDPTEVKSYWVVYNIPAETRDLSEGAAEIGIMGYNDKDKPEYDPMKSKGPGIKQYFVTLYALSDMLEFDTKKIYREDLLDAIKDITIEHCTLQYTYERQRQQEGK